MFSKAINLNQQNQIPMKQRFTVKTRNAMPSNINEYCNRYLNCITTLPWHVQLYLTTGSLWSDDDSAPSSECESRESSAGSSRSGNQSVFRRSKGLSQLPPTPTRTGQIRDQYLQQLSVDIPNSCKFTINLAFS